MIPQSVTLVCSEKFPETVPGHTSTTFGRSRFKRVLPRRKLYSHLPVKGRNQQNKKHAAVLFRDPCAKRDIPLIHMTFQRRHNEQPSGQVALHRTDTM